MSVKSTKEHVAQIIDLLQTQNRNARKRIKERQLAASENHRRSKIAFDKYNLIKNYVSNTLIEKLNNARENQRYTLFLTDNSSSASHNDILPYFKIIIKNNVSNYTNFISVSFNLDVFFIKQKKINSNNELDITEMQVPVGKFNKLNMRIILFNYFSEIIAKDTFRRYPAYLNEENY